MKEEVLTLLTIMLRCQLPVTARLSHHHVHPSDTEQSFVMTAWTYVKE